MYAASDILRSRLWMTQGINLSRKVSMSGERLLSKSRRPLSRGTSKTRPVFLERSRSSKYTLTDRLGRLSKTLDSLTILLPEGGDLVYKDGQTWLPVHKLWLLVFRLRGRYDVRRDRGQAIVQEDLSASRVDHEYCHNREHQNDEDELSGVFYITQRSPAWHHDACIYFTPLQQTIAWESVER
ncbi:hypothetical protein K458DRAFT_158625 [Lentithecium fluviatile CBS 122367]|uniref:Uncharacterized protein n=1 Tax=Lentithecium fluviatile CBS 122367 TaxID=1168545 RepID=A0A6G1II05_9PLEO|nr:hypothetical protein K458DRAFT_158625 [Lentithecium fluviatile CBS 122367]